MATETKIQELVHKLEHGGWAKWIKLAVLLACIAYMLNLWFFRENGFKGLSMPKAMEQAQIGREVARGNGFSTKMIRPAAVWQFEKNKGEIPLERTPDTYHAPLNPLVEGVVFKGVFIVNDWLKGLAAKGMHFFARFTFDEEMTRETLVYSLDKVVAAIQLVFFFLGVLVTYFTVRRLFDHKLAIFTVGLLLLCDLLWDYSLSGLPQMLMFFLLSCATYCLVRAVDREVHPFDEDETAVAELSEPAEGGEVEAAPVVVRRRAGRFAKLGATPLPWLLGAAAFFGLLALTHGLTIWIFAGALTFCGIYFRRRAVVIVGMLAVFSLLYTPWLVRTYQVSGSIAGMAAYSGVFQIRGTESAVMRSMDPPLSGVTPLLFRNKVQAQIIGQFDRIYGRFGAIIVAPIFFLALLHPFRRRETAAFKWCVLLMWMFATLGMAVFGLEGLALDANDLHVLFIPLLTCFGLAFTLVLWTRLNIHVNLLRTLFIGLIFILSSLQFFTRFVELHSQRSGFPIHWPPYYPSSIGQLGQFIEPQEIIMSDMPWAVAWYADRKSIWLPMTVKEFTNLNDYNLLKSPIVAMYLTPVTGNAEFLRGIMKGEYKEWSPWITRNANIRNFPLRAATALPIDGDAVIYADRDRWTTRDD
ncbi:MAG: glycosyltransferase family 39 protein [Chthoniobacteraceae bacterium]